MWRGWPRWCVRPRDWLILAVLMGAALWLGGPLIQEMPIARYLRGECPSPRGCGPAPNDPRRHGPERITTGPGIITMALGQAYEPGPVETV